MLRIRESRGRSQVLLNGKLLLDDVSLTDPGTIELLDPSELRKLEECTFSDLNDIGVELSQLFDLTALRYFTILPPLKILGTETPKEHFTIEYYFQFELRDWKQPYSFAEYTQELLRISESMRLANVEFTRCDLGDDPYGDYDSFTIKFSVLDPTVPIGGEIKRTFELVKEICSQPVSVFLIKNTTERSEPTLDFRMKKHHPIVSAATSNGQWAGEAIVEIIENQVRNNTPPEVRQTLDRLMRMGETRESAIRYIACALSTELFYIFKNNAEFNESRYKANLNALPKLPDE